MSTNVDAYVNSVAVARNAAVLPLVQDVVPAADTAYAYSGAVRVGLSRLSSARRNYQPGEFGQLVDATSALVTIAVEDDDVVRADAIATAMSVTRAVVVSAAACTGLAMLAGVDDRITGPFSP